VWRECSSAFILGGGITLAQATTESAGANNRGGKTVNWYLEVLKKYAVFDGRARRKEYWMFILFNIIITAVLALIDSLIGTIIRQGGFGLLQGLYDLAVLIPSIAVTVRRLHDTGRTGWWILIGLIPVIGGIVLLIFMLLDSEPGENQYGPNPKAEEAIA
jgi:uncharacterized membrane protein YhaH (DUF805 family)